MAGEIYVVQKGDTLIKIAAKFNTTVKNLVQWNNIEDPNFIVVGQKLHVDGGNVLTPPPPPQKYPYVKNFGLQSNTDRTVYASWTWSREDTEEYEIEWHYYTGDDVWFVASKETVSIKQSIYTAPANATIVNFKVKAIAKTKKTNGKEAPVWTAEWSPQKHYYFKDNPPVQPSKPNVSFDKLTSKLTARLDNIDLNADCIEYQIIEGQDTVYATSKVDIVRDSAVYTKKLSPGKEYRVHCRSLMKKTKEKSEWSEYTDVITTMPPAPEKIIQCKATSESSVYIAWSKASTATSYEIQYTTKEANFTGNDQVESFTTDETHYNKHGLTSGEKYFFRVRAANANGESSWTAAVAVIVGKKPAAPTTWSSTTTAVVGEPVNLYWVHNSQDGSEETGARIEIYVDGVLSFTTTQKKPDNGDEPDEVSVYDLDTSIYKEGAEIQWRVRTYGILAEPSDWSIQRTIYIYANPTFDHFYMKDAKGTDIDTLVSYPFYVSALAAPSNDVQRPNGYHISVIANGNYESFDQVGNVRVVRAGDQIYSKHFDQASVIDAEFSAGNIDLANNESYTLKCVASMSSGLTVEETIEFSVEWGEESYEYEPNAIVTFDPDTFACEISPYCTKFVQDENGEYTQEVLIEDLSLSVYRREYDGKFTELETGIDNALRTTITDPHPALDYARYRVVAKSNTTGAVGYFDIPGVPVGVSSVIIQWNEAWSSFDVIGEDLQQVPAWSGSLLKLPYNINITSNSSPDVSLVEYIGREHPVSYYGTQVGETATWTMEIDKEDQETIYALRRLAKWMGDVYVREPSGVGYWANITVAFSQNYSDVTVPVTLSISRVEGGI